MPRSWSGATRHDATRPTIPGRSDTNRRVRVLSTAALAVLTIVAVGCREDHNNGSESRGAGKVTGVQAGTGSRRDEAAQAGKKAAEAAGDNVDLPRMRAGILQIVGA